MDIAHVKEGEISIITINGRLDAATAPVADKTVKKILEGDCLRMLFDFSKLDYLSCGGLRVILKATKELRRKGGQIVLCSHSNLVREIFEISGFNSVVPIAESVESGIDQFGGKAVATVYEFRGTGFGAPPFGLRPHKQGSASDRLKGAKYAKDTERAMR